MGAGFQVPVGIRTAVRLAFHEKAVRQDANSSFIDNSYGCASPTRIQMLGLSEPTLHGWIPPRPVWEDDFVNGVLRGLHRVGLRPARSSIVSRYYVDMDVPCRQCEACLKNRGRMWAARALRETKQAERTWFCTYTVNPENRVRVRIAARRAYGSEDYLALYKVISKDFTKYLKRVRKESGSTIRFLLAAERHNDGFPHLHALIHEVKGGVTKRTLQGQWTLGFSHVRLTDGKEAHYVTKYISKQYLARVRASLRYGLCLSS